MAYLKKKIHALVQNNGLEVILAGIILTLLIIAHGSDDDTREIIDWTIFFALVAMVFLQAFSRAIAALIANFTEDSCKLTEDYEYLVGRYPEADSESVGLYACENASQDGEHIVQEIPSDFCFQRLPIVVDGEFSEPVNVKVEDSKEIFEPPRFIKRHYDELMSAHKASNVYNRLCVRVDSWECQNSCLTIHAARTTYFESLITNRAADYALRSGITLRDKYQYGPFIPELTKSSPFSNHLGINGFIVSADGFVLFFERDRNVSIGKKTYGASVGAVLKTRYALNEKGELTKEGIERAILKSIEEETKLRADDLETFTLKDNIIAAYRDLVEAGKPQLLFYAKARLTKNDINMRLFCEDVLSRKDHRIWNKRVFPSADGFRVIWLSLPEIKAAVIHPNSLTCGGKERKIVPSVAASIDLFRRLAPFQWDELQ